MKSPILILIFFIMLFCFQSKAQSQQDYYKISPAAFTKLERNEFCSLVKDSIPKYFKHPFVNMEKLSYKEMIMIALYHNTAELYFDSYGPFNQLCDEETNEILGNIVLSVDDFWGNPLMYMKGGYLYIKKDLSDEPVMLFYKLEIDVDFVQKMKLKEIEKEQFSSKSLKLDPHLGYKESIYASKLKSISPDLENWYSNFNHIAGFDLVIVENGNKISLKSNGSMFTKEQLSLIKKLKKGSTFSIKNMLILYENELKSLADIKYTVN